jgi:hypothetical protein
MNTSRIDGRMNALRALGRWVGVASVATAATYLTVTAWLLLTLAGV